jgi:hypothetical protein
VVVADGERENTPLFHEPEAGALGWFNSLMARWILQSLRKWAYSQEDFRRIVGETPFRSCAINRDGIGLQVALRK